VGLNSLKSLNLTNVYPNNKKNKNKVKSKPLELYELAGKNTRFENEKQLQFKLKFSSYDHLEIFSILN
jgi:hypothetical protein